MYLDYTLCVDIATLPAAKLAFPRFNLVIKAKQAEQGILYRKQGILFSVIGLSCTNCEIVQAIVLYRRDEIVIRAYVADQTGMLVLKHTSVHAVCQVIRNL